MNRDHEIEVVLRDAATLRRCGTAMSDERALKEKLAEALDKIDALEEHGCEHGECEECDKNTEDSELAKDCGLTSKERDAGKLCKLLDNCAECRVHGGLKDVRAETAELQAKYDKALDELIGLRSRPTDSVRSFADCGIDRTPESACKFRDDPSGICSECMVHAMGLSLDRKEQERRDVAAELESVLAQLATKTKALEFVTAERDRLLLETQQSEKKPAPVRRPRPPSIDPAQINLFELVKKVLESKAETAKPAKRRGRPPKQKAAPPVPTEDV